MPKVIKKQCNTCLFWTGDKKAKGRWTCTASVPWWVEHNPDESSPMTLGRCGFNCPSWTPDIVVIHRGRKKT